MAEQPDHIPGARDVMDSPSAWLNAPNALTTLRLIMVPILGWLLLAEGGDNEVYRWWAAVVFLVASITDFFDGWLARRNNLETAFGKVADPLADKTLTGVALISLSIIGDLPWWATVVILVREIGVTILRAIVIRHGVIPASRGGKAKTVLQMATIVLYIIPVTGLLADLRFPILLVTIVVTVVTGIDYVGRAVTMRRNSARTAAKHARDDDDPPR